MIFSFVHAISILEFNIFWHIARNTSGCLGLAIQLLMKTSHHVHGGLRLCFKECNFPSTSQLILNMEPAYDISFLSNRVRKFIIKSTSCISSIKKVL